MKEFEPQLTKITDRKVLTVTTLGDPNSIDPKYFKALYGAAYHAKMKIYKPKGVKMELGKLTALWPDAHLKPKEEWTAVWAVPVPDYFTDKDLIQKDENIPVTLEVWPSGTYAEILHLGPYSEEGPTVAKLHEFIERQRIKIKDVPGTHEEEYLTSPNAKVVKTIIRYRIR